MNNKLPIDNSTIPKIRIMGVNIAAINMKWLMRYTIDHIDEMSGNYICVANVHTTVMSYEDEEYRFIQNNALMTIPDGAPLSYLGRSRGAIYMRRTTGPDYLQEVLRISQKNGWSHFFFGSTNETLERLRKYLLENFPGVLIAGMYSPPFRELTKEEDERILESINSKKPSFIWIGLGAPKQERWMAEHQGKIKGVMIGIGAAFDYYAGNIKRAPLWMQRVGLEWLFRLLQEPRRLLKRYLVTNSLFIWNAIICRK